MAQFNLNEPLFSVPKSTQSYVNESQFYNPTQAKQPLFSQTPLGQGTGGALSGLTAGLSGAESQTTEQGVLNALLGGASGASAGAMVGGPVGAVTGGVIGLVSAGVKSWFDIKNSRKKDREMKRLREEAKKEQLRQEAIAEKWRRINRLDSLQEAKFNQNQVMLQNKWAGFQEAQKALFNLTNSDQNLNQLMRNQLRQVA